MNLRDPSVRLNALRSALVSIAEELAMATQGEGTEAALEERVGRISHIAASAVMTVRGELPHVTSLTPMFVKCPACNKFHAPGFCSEITR